MNLRELVDTPSVRESTNPQPLSARDYAIIEAARRSKDAGHRLTAEAARLQQVQLMSTRHQLQRIERVLIDNIAYARTFQRGEAPPHLLETIATLQHMRAEHQALLGEEAA